MKYLSEKQQKAAEAQERHQQAAASHLAASLAGEPLEAHVEALHAAAADLKAANALEELYKCFNTPLDLPFCEKDQVKPGTGNVQISTHSMIRHDPFIAGESETVIETEQGPDFGKSVERVIRAASGGGIWLLQAHPHHVEDRSYIRHLCYCAPCALRLKPEEYVRER